MFYVGFVRHVLLMPFSCRWNAWVRDGAARLEIIAPWLISSSEGSIGQRWCCRVRHCERNEK